MCYENIDENSEVQWMNTVILPVFIIEDDANLSQNLAKS
jgi:hypothetical protein